MSEIKHVWFDMDGTLTIHTPEFEEIHNALRYKAYSDVTGRPVDKVLIAEYEALYKKYSSNSAVFTALGKPNDFWMHYYGQINQGQFYKPIADVFETLDALRKLTPISLFTNDKLENAKKTLWVVQVNPEWFTHIISGDDVANRKPALDGFHLMLERSNLPANEILYVGDRVDVDIKPAKSLGMLSGLVYSKSNEADYCFDTLKDLLPLFE